MPPPGPAIPGPAALPVAGVTVTSTNPVQTIVIDFRAVNVEGASFSGNNAFALAVIKEIKTNSFFDPEGTVAGTITMDPVQTNTFVFTITAKPRRQLKL
jgi:hypothetical protein